MTAPSSAGQTGFDPIGDVRGVTRASLATLRDQLAGTADSGADLDGLGTDLFGIAGILDQQPTLRRTLTDPSVAEQARSDLARGLFADKVGAPAVELVAAAAGLPWARLRDLADAMEHLAVLAEVIQAERAGVLDDVEDELFRFGRVVAGDRELQAALASNQAPAERRRELVGALLTDRVNAVSKRLVEQAAVSPRGQTFADALTYYVDLAARWKQRQIATVRTATALDDGQRQRLAAALARQVGHEVHLNVIVDPQLLGGLRVELGDDVIEGTVSNRLAEAARRLAG